ncbi:MAG: co-chaperone GroES [Candidatus Spechtbacterales bacterium]
MRVSPLRDNVIIEPQKPEEVTESGIVLPESVDKKGPEQGTVVAVGPGRKNDEGETIALEVKKGDTVLFTRGYSSEPLKFEGREYLLVKADDIIAKLE